MQTLLKNTNAYRLLKKEREENRLSHTYLILMDDARSLREALTFFAKVFFACEDDYETSEKKRISTLIDKESFADCLFYPKQDKKFTVADADAIKEESSLNPVEGDKKLFVIGDFAEVGVAQRRLTLFYKRCFRVRKSWKFPPFPKVKSLRFCAVTIPIKQGTRKK